MHHREHDGYVKEFELDPDEGAPECEVVEVVTNCADLHYCKKILARIQLGSVVEISTPPVNKYSSDLAAP
jgi:hypothetical protein